MTDFSNQVSSLIPEVIIGVSLSVLWLPAVFLSEVNNKNNRLEEKELDKILKDVCSDTNKNTPRGLIQGTLEHDRTNMTPPLKIFDFTEINISLGYREKITDYPQASFVPVDTFLNSKLIYVKQVLTATKKYNVPDNKGNISQRKVDLPETNTIIKSFGNINFIENGTDTTKTNIKISDIENITNKINGPEYTFQDTDVNKTIYTYKYTYYTIDQNQPVVNTSILHNNDTEKKTEMKFYMFENGTTVDDVKQLLIDRKKGEDTFFKWIFRIGTFLMLIGSFQLLMAPIKFVLNNSTSIVSTIPVLNVLGSFVNLFGNTFLAILTVLGVFASLVLTIVMTAVIYGLINYTLEVGIFVALLVGIIIFYHMKE